MLKKLLPLEKLCDIKQVVIVDEETQFDYVCDQCSSQFQTEMELSEHMDEHEDKYACVECELSFAKITELGLHAQMHLDSKSYRCHVCEFETTLKASFLAHVKKHADEEYRYECEICKKKYVGRVPFEEHLELHADVKRFNCEFCPKKFAVRRYWQVHRKLNHQLELYGVQESHICHVCYRVFKFSNSLVRHLRTIHKVGKDITKQCPICPRVLSNSYYLKLHMRVHTGEKPFICDICGKGFAKNYKLSKHLLMHNKT